MFLNRVKSEIYVHHDPTDFAIKNPIHNLQLEFQLKRFTLAHNILSYGGKITERGPPEFKTKNHK